MRDLSFSALCFLFKRKNLQLHLFHGFDKRMTHTALSPESSGTHDLLLSPDVISRQKNKQSVAADRDTEDVRECEEQEIKRWRRTCSCRERAQSELCRADRILDNRRTELDVCEYCYLSNR